MNNDIYLNEELQGQAQEIRAIEQQLRDELNAERIAEGKEPVEYGEYYIDTLIKKLQRSVII